MTVKKGFECLQRASSRAILCGKADEPDDRKNKKRFIVRKLIEKVIVFDDHFKVLFKVGIEVEVEA